MTRRLRHGEEATLVEHLGELRTRLVVALFALAGGFAVAFAFHERLVAVLTRPLPHDRELITLGVTEPFFITVKISLYAGLALALPVVLYQLWAFLAPALEEGTQRVASVFAAFATVLFAGGVAFAYGVVLPKALGFLTSFGSGLYDVQVRASSYYSFVTLALFGIGLVFQLPIFVLALVRLQIVTAEQLRRNWRLGVVAIVVVAAALPTVDPVSLAFEIVPLLLLYAASIWLAGVMERRWSRGGVLWTAPAAE